MADEHGDVHARFEVVTRDVVGHTAIATAVEECLDVRMVRTPEHEFGPLLGRHLLETDPDLPARVSIVDFFEGGNPWGGGQHAVFQRKQRAGRRGRG